MTNAQLDHGQDKFLCQPQAPPHWKNLLVPFKPQGITPLASGMPGGPTGALFSRGWCFASGYKGEGTEVNMETLFHFKLSMCKVQCWAALEPCDRGFARKNITLPRLHGCGHGLASRKALVCIEGAGGTERRWGLTVVSRRRTYDFSFGLVVGVQFKYLHPPCQANEAQGEWAACIY